MPTINEGITQVLKVLREKGVSDTDLLNYLINNFLEPVELYMALVRFADEWNYDIGIKEDES